MRTANTRRLLWTPAAITAAAAMHPTRAAFRAALPGAYQAAARAGMLATLQHSTPPAPATTTTATTATTTTTTPGDALAAWRAAMAEK